LKAVYPDLDLIFTEYSTKELNTAKWNSNQMLLILDSPETGRFKKAYKKNGAWVLFFDG